MSKQGFKSRTQCAVGFSFFRSLNLSKLDAERRYPEIVMEFSHIIDPIIDPILDPTIHPTIHPTIDPTINPTIGPIIDH